MPPQAAYDVDAPNGSARRPPGDRVISIFRLYRKVSAVQLAPAGGTPSSFDLSLGGIRSGIQGLREEVRGFTSKYLAPTIGPLAGRILEKEFQFVLILERTEQATDLRTSFSYVRDGYFIDTPLANGRGVTRFSISGRTHWTPVLVNGVPVDGDSALKDFQELIDDYFFPAKKRGAVTADYELYWINLNAPISAEDPFGEFEWLIHPIGRGLRISQSAQRPFQRFFTFEFLGLESNRDRAKADDGFLAGLFSRGFLARLLDALPIDGVRQAIDDVFGIATDTRALMDDVANVVTTVNDYLTGLTQFIKASFAQVRSLLTGIQTIIGRIQDGINILRSLPDLFSEQWRLLQQNWPGLVTDPDTGIIAIDQCNRLRDVLFALAAQPHLFQPPIISTVPAGALTQSVTLPIPPGASIDTVAREAEVDIDTLIAANNLRYPFVSPGPRPERQRAAAEAAEIESRRLVGLAQGAIEAAVAAGKPAADVDYLNRERDRAILRAAAAEQALDALDALGQSQPGVLYAGDPIRVPDTRAAARPSIRPLDPELEAAVTLLTNQPVSDEDRIFGFDLELDDDGNLVWNVDRADLAIERGLDHIARVQTRYVQLPLGALRFAPGLGNHAHDALPAAAHRPHLEPGDDLLPAEAVVKRAHVLLPHRPEILRPAPAVAGRVLPFQRRHRARHPADAPPAIQFDGEGVVEEIEDPVQLLRHSSPCAVRLPVRPGRGRVGVRAHPAARMSICSCRLVKLRRWVGER